MYPSLHLDPANPYGYDPEKAKSLLDAAGYKVGSDGIRADAQGNRLSFRLFGRTRLLGQQLAEGRRSSSRATSTAVGSRGHRRRWCPRTTSPTLIGEGNFDMFEWGWVVEPDPNYQLSTFTCANRSYKDGDAIYANLSDSFYCNPAYDKLFDQQSVETDVAKRTEIVKQMQQMLYDDAPYVVTYYYDNPEAYRSRPLHRLRRRSPRRNGSLLFQYGTWSLREHQAGHAPRAPRERAGQPSAGTGSTESESSTNWPLIIGSRVLVAAGRARRRHRRSAAGATATCATDDDRE